MAGEKRPHAKHTYIYYVCTSKYRSDSNLTASHASKNSSSEMVVYAWGTLGYFHHKIVRVLAKISTLGEFHVQLEQYPNSFKCISSLFLCLQRDIQQTLW